jgi:hypothetical protein
MPSSSFGPAIAACGTTPQWLLRTVTSFGGNGTITGITVCRLPASLITSCTRRLLGVGAITGTELIVSLRPNLPPVLEYEPAAEIYSQAMASRKL